MVILEFIRHVLVKWRKDRASRMAAALAYYSVQDGEHSRELRDGVRVWEVNRLLLLEKLFAAVHEGRLWLPQHARQLGGRVKDGVGEYYRQMTALDRVLERNAVSNWVAR